MTSRIDIDQVLDGYLADGPERVGDQALLRALDAIDQTKQRRDLFAPWRFSQMVIYPRLAAVALVAVIAVGGAMYMLGQRNPVGVPAPTASPAVPTQAPSGAAAQVTAGPVDTSLWNPFTSAFYGFTVKYPGGGWSLAPATGHWDYATQDAADVDTLFSPTGWPDFTGFETRLPAGKTGDEFLKDFTLPAVIHACYPQPGAWTKTTVDGHPASIAYAGCNEHFYFAQASVVIGKRIWIFNLDGPDRSLIVPFLSTVTIDPSAVVD